jgi:hypothetical protein
MPNVMQTAGAIANPKMNTPHVHERLCFGGEGMDERRAKVAFVGLAVFKSEAVYPDIISS